MEGGSTEKESGQSSRPRGSRHGPGRGRVSDEGMTRSTSAVCGAPTVRLPLLGPGGEERGSRSKEKTGDCGWAPSVRGLGPSCQCAQGTGLGGMPLPVPLLGSVPSQCRLGTRPALLPSCSWGAGLSSSWMEWGRSVDSFGQHSAGRWMSGRLVSREVGVQAVAAGR